MGGLEKEDFSLTGHWQLLAETLPLQDSGCICNVMEGEEEEKGMEEMKKSRVCRKQRPKLYDQSVTKLRLGPQCIWP